MRTIPSPVADRLERDLDAARRAASVGDLEAAWRSLEEAHVLSQAWARPHVRVHGRMLGLAVRTRAWREAAGQLLRLAVAAPGSLTRRFPVGNTGRAGVGLMTPMPVSDEVARLLGG